MSAGEILPMIVAETEPVGGFIGDSFVVPIFQGGLLATYVLFIFMQDPWLGLAAIALWPPQMVLIPKLQRKINLLAKERVQTARQLSDRIGESIAGFSEIRGNDTTKMLANVFYNPGPVGTKLEYGYRGTPTESALGSDANDTLLSITHPALSNRFGADNSYNLAQRNHDAIEQLFAPDDSLSLRERVRVWVF